MLNAGLKRRRNGLQRDERREQQGVDEDVDGFHGDLLIWMVHWLFTARVVMTAGNLVLGEGGRGPAKTRFPRLLGDKLEHVPVERVELPALQRREFCLFQLPDISDAEASPIRDA